MRKSIKAILFDSGRTLNVPSTGHWFITPKFFEIVDEAKFLNKQEIVEKAMEKACEYVNKITFVMSSVYGSFKAEKILFKIAIDELKIEPGEAVFVDDSEKNLAAAEEFGMLPIMIDRYDIKDLKSNYPIIRSLNEIEEYL